MLTLLMSQFSFAQGIPGLNMGNYAGISGFDLQPASIADSRYLIDVNLAGADFHFTNNAIGVKSKYLYNGDVFKASGEDFRSRYIKSHIGSFSNASAFLSAQIQTPSFMYTVNRRLAVAFTSSVRMMFNIQGLSNSLADVLYNQNSNRQNYGVAMKENQMAINAMAWQEYGIGAGYVLKPDGNIFIKIGGRVKFTPGISSGYVYGDDVNYRWENKDSLSLYSARFGYGHSQSFEVDKNAFKYNRFDASGSFGADAGIVFEYRPVNDKYHNIEGKVMDQPQEVHQYKFKLGISVTDVGSIRFAKAHDSRDFTANVQHWNLRQFHISGNGTPVANIDDTLHRRFTQRDGKDYFNMSLPTAFSLQLDYPFYNGFAVSLITHNSPSFLKYEHKLVALDYYQLSPRWECKWIGAYIPFTYNEYREFNAGVALRLGPVLVGTNDVSTLLWKSEVRSASVYFALKVPIFRKHKIGVRQNSPVESLYDSDGDGVADSVDNCPRVKGLKELGGCPPEAQKSDSLGQDKVQVPVWDTVFKAKDQGTIVEKTEDKPVKADSVLVDKSSKPDTKDEPANPASKSVPDIAAATTGSGKTGATKKKTDLAKKSAALKSAHNIAAKKQVRKKVLATSSSRNETARSKKPLLKKGMVAATPLIPKKKYQVNKLYQKPVRQHYAWKPKNALERKLQRQDSGIAVIRFQRSMEGIKGQNLQVLQSLSKVLKAHPQWRVRLIGHADNSGSASANIVISMQRTYSLKKSLVIRGISPLQIETHYYGAARPMADNSTAEGRAMNRRVEVRLICSGGLGNTAKYMEAYRIASESIDKTKSGIQTPENHYSSLPDRIRLSKHIE